MMTQVWHLTRNDASLSCKRNNQTNKSAQTGSAKHKSFFPRTVNKNWNFDWPTSNLIISPDRFIPKKNDANVQNRSLTSDRTIGFSRISSQASHPRTFDADIADGRLGDCRQGNCRQGDSRRKFWAQQLHKRGEIMLDQNAIMFKTKFKWPVDRWTSIYISVIFIYKHLAKHNYKTFCLSWPKLPKSNN